MLGVSPKTVEFLKQLGHEAVHVRTLGLQRDGDPQLVERARADASVVLTFDLDFGETNHASSSSGSRMNVPIPSTSICRQSSRSAWLTSNQGR